jgi:hypothetical protein
MPKNHPIPVRYSEDEKERVMKKAKMLGMKLSEYIRFISLNADVEVKARDVYQK